MFRVNSFHRRFSAFAARRIGARPSPYRRRSLPPLRVESLEDRVCPALTLTEPGHDLGYQLSVFARDFPTPPSSIAFPDSGGVLVSTEGGGVWLFPRDRDEQIANPFPDHNYTTGNAEDLAKAGSTIYMTQQTRGRVIYINDDGSANQDQLIARLPRAYGMVANPVTGHLFVDDGRGGHIYDVDPQGHTSTLFLTTTGRLAGLAISADGSTLYAANQTDDDVVGYKIATRNRVFKIDLPSAPDGVVLGIAPFAGHLYTNTDGGEVFDVDLAGITRTRIANQGSVGSFLTVDPSDGSVLITQDARIYRLTLPPLPATSIQLQSPSGVIAGTPFVINAIAFDALGRVATGYTGTVTFTSSDPYPAALPANYTFTAYERGVHTFSGVTLFTAGSQTVTAQDTADSSITGNAAVTVAAAPANHLLLAASTATVVGMPFGMTLTALDPYGNVDTNYAGTVAFQSSDPYPGLLPSNYTFTASDNGTHAFSASLFTAGTQTVTAQDTANGATTGSGAITVVAAPANHFLLTAPLTAVSGIPFDVMVTALDPYGNVDTNYGGTVAFTSSDTDPGVVLPGNYTFQMTDSGTHTFAAGVTLITPGDQTLTVTDTTNATIIGTALSTVNSPAPPPGGGANVPPSPSRNPEMAPLPNAQPLAFVDRLFALLNQNDDSVRWPAWQHFRQSDAHRWALDLLVPKDPVAV
jgi:hypothetical protein